MNSINSKKAFLEKVRSRNGQVLTPYTLNKAPVRILCEQGHEFETTPNQIKQNRWCSQCRERSSEQSRIRFENRVTQLRGSIHGKYSGSINKVPVSCSEGHFFEIAPYSVRDGHWCVICARLSGSDCRSRFQDLILQKGGSILGTYQNSYSLIQLVCNEGHVFERVPRSIFQGIWCPICQPKREPLESEAKVRFMNMVKEKEATCGKYQNFYTPVEIVCKSGHTFQLSPRLVKRGEWCPDCE